MVPQLFETHHRNFSIVSWILSHNNNYGARATLKVIDIVSLRAEMLGMEELMSGDEYLFVRDIYLQTREYEIRDGDLDNAFDDFEDYEDFEDYDDYY